MADRVKLRKIKVAKFLKNKSMCFYCAYNGLNHKSAAVFGSRESERKDVFKSGTQNMGQRKGMHEARRP